MAKSRSPHSFFLSFASSAQLLSKAMSILVPLLALCLLSSSEEIQCPNPVRINFDRRATRVIAVEFTSRVQRYCFEVTAQAGEHMTAKIEAFANDNSTAAGFVISPSGKLTGGPGFFFNSELSETGVYRISVTPRTITPGVRFHRRFRLTVTLSKREKLQPSLKEPNSKTPKRPGLRRETHCRALRLRMA